MSYQFITTIRRLFKIVDDAKDLVNATGCSVREGYCQSDKDYTKVATWQGF